MRTPRSPASVKRACQKVKGEVIKVEQHVRTRNGDEYDRLTIHARQGEERRPGLRSRQGKGRWRWDHRSPGQ